MRGLVSLLLMLTAGFVLFAGEASAAAVQAGTRPWPGGRVRVWVEPDVRADAAKFGKLTRAMAAWRAATGMRIELTTVVGPPALFVFNRTGSHKCDATLGYFPRLAHDRTVLNGGAMTLGDCSYGSTLHEFGHVLGLMHEHQRDDRLGYISFSPVADILRSCGTRPGGCGEAQQNVGAPLRMQLASPYDPCSLMHYLPDQTAKARAGRVPPGLGWSQFYVLTDAGRRQFAACKAVLLHTEGCAWWKTGQKCEITCQDANTAAAFNGLRPRQPCWGKGPSRRP